MGDDSVKRPQADGRAGMKKELSEHFKAYRHVWVFVEYEHGAIHPVSLELLGEGRKLAGRLGCELAGVLLGSGRQALAGAVSELWERGADLVYLCDDPVLEHYRNEPYARALTGIVNTHKPEILLLGATTLGRDLAGSVATTLMTGLTADCTGLEIDGERSLAATRPTFGGSLMCTIHTLNFRPQMATVRPRVMSMPEREPGRTGRVIGYDLDMREEDVVTKVLRFLPDRDSAKSQLAYADVVVAGGLGLRSPENMQLVRNLAGVLGGEWGGSRPLVQR